jgi:hypothetical protein
MKKGDCEMILRGLNLICGMEESEATRIEVYLEHEAKGPLLGKKPGPPKTRFFANKWSKAVRKRAQQAYVLIERIKAGELN